MSKQAWRILHAHLSRPYEGDTVTMRRVHVHLIPLETHTGPLDVQYDVVLWNVGNESVLELLLEVIGYLNVFILHKYERYIPTDMLHQHEE